MSLLLSKEESSPEQTRGDNAISKSDQAIVSDAASEDLKKDSLEAVNTATTLVIPVIEEHLSVSKQLLTTDVVHVRKSVREHEVAISEPLTVEAVHVERVPMNLIVESAPSVRTEGDVTVIPVVEEVLVTTKQLRLVEELRVTKRRSTDLHQENVTLRSEEITVDRQNSGSPNQAGEERPD